MRTETTLNKVFDKIDFYGATAHEFTIQGRKYSHSIAGVILSVVQAIGLLFILYIKLGFVFMN